MTSLYELTKQEQDLLAEIEGLIEPEPDPESGEVPDNAGKLTDLIKTQIEVEYKLEDYLHVIEHLEHRAAIAEADYKAKKEIIERSHKVAKSAENKVVTLKARILEYLQNTGKEDMLLPSGRGFKVQKNGGKPAVIIPDAPKYSQWDDDLFSVEYSPNRDAIIAAEKEGRKLPEGVYTYRGYHLKIK